MVGQGTKSETASVNIYSITTADEKEQTDKLTGGGFYIDTPGLADSDKSKTDDDTKRMFLPRW